MFRFYVLVIVAVTQMNTVALAQTMDTLRVAPQFATDSVQSFARDPAIWIHPDAPGQSLILGTDIGTYPNGGLFVWNLDGSQQQRITISHPRQVDVAYDFLLDGELVDIAVVAMRDHDELWVYKIDPQTRQLEDVTSAAFIETLISPFGLALYRRPADGELFAFVSNQDEFAPNQVQQLRLHDDGSGKVGGTQVRILSGLADNASAITVDAALGYVYFAEDSAGVSKYFANPDDGDQRLTTFATDDGITGSRAGIALYACSDSAGYILVSSPADETILVYERNGDAEPHSHALVAGIKNPSGHGEGLDITNRNLNGQFSQGMLIWHDQPGNRFQLFAWEQVAQNSLNVCIDGVPTSVDLGSHTPPGRFQLQQNYPNPFNPGTRIDFQLSEAGKVKLTIFNLLGEEVRTLLNQAMPAGTHSLAWDGIDNTGSPAASGVYIYEIKSDTFSESRRMVLSR